MNDLDWQVIEDLEVVLEVTLPFRRLTLHADTLLFQIPHAAQQCMSGESTPLLSGAVPAFETFMAHWEELSAAVPRCSSFIRVGLDYAKTYYKRMGKTRAYAIAMRKF